MFGSLFSSPILYFKLDSRRIQGLNCANGAVLDEPPLLAIRHHEKHKVTAAWGNAARSLTGQQNTQLINPFEHPRLLLADFSYAEVLMKLVLRDLHKGLLRPTVIIHPMEKIEGGLSQIEARAFQELGLGIGARKVYLWQGRALSHDEVCQLTFPLQEGELTNT